jgi:hypothetical protein
VREDQAQHVPTGPPYLGFRPFPLDLNNATTITTTTIRFC